MHRVGFGFDSHRFVAGRPLMLGGVKVEHDKGLAGHSDADAALHALIDALLGAACLGDIGEQFPDTDPRWAGADSAVMLADTVAMVLQGGWVPVNADLTILAERPRLGPAKLAMRERIADLLGLDLSAVSVKAKTAEGMGAIGAGEGLAVYAVVLVEELGE